MGIKHVTIKAPHEKVHAIPDWNPDHVIDGDVDFNGHKGTGAGDPSSNQDLATKKYVDSHAGATEDLQAVLEYGRSAIVNEPDYSMYIENEGSGEGIISFIFGSFGGTFIANDNYGVYGRAGNAFGVIGEAIGGSYGVYGQAGQTIGVYGGASGTGGEFVAYTGSVGVYGEACIDYGVYGRAAGNYGGYFYAPSGNYGVYGWAQTYGVYGHSEHDYGIYAEAQLNYGGYFKANQYAVYGETHNGNYGGYFKADNGDYGVWAEATYDYGICGIAGNEFGVYGQANGVGTKQYAGYFKQNEYVGWNLGVGIDAPDFLGDENLRNGALINGDYWDASDNFTLMNDDCYYDQLGTTGVASGFWQLNENLNLIFAPFKKYKFTYTIGDAYLIAETSTRARIGAPLADKDYYLDLTDGTHSLYFITSSGAASEAFTIVAFSYENINDSLTDGSFNGFSETLGNPIMFGGAYWQAYNDFSFPGAPPWGADFLDTLGNGTLTQYSADFQTPAVANKIYDFTYTILANSLGVLDLAAKITSSFASVDTALILADGTHTTSFTSAASPTDFIISVTSSSGGSGEGFHLSDCSLKERIAWTTTGDFSLASGEADYSDNTGSGTLTQAQADLAIVGEAARYYTFYYSIPNSSVLGPDVQAWITTDFASTDTYLDLTQGDHSVTFTSSNSPTDFIISVTSSNGEGFSINNMRLKDNDGRFVIGDLSCAEITTGNIGAGNNIDGKSYSAGGTAGANGTFSNPTSITVKHGIVTSVS